MVVAIIQARMSSSRLQGKVMKEILGRPVLWHLINRLKRSKLIDKIVVATTTNEIDNPIVQLAESLGIAVYRGSEENVLDRYYHAARKYDAETIVRITADCPLIDPEVVDTIVGKYLENKNELDYVKTGRGYPDGLDTEVFSFFALEKTWREAQKKSERGEYVTPYIWKNPHLFGILEVENDEDLSQMRWVVDYERDFELVTEIFKNLYREGEVFHLRDVLNFLNKHPALAESNRGLINPEYYKSIAEED